MVFTFTVFVIVVGGGVLILQNKLSVPTLVAGRRRRWCRCCCFGQLNRRTDHKISHIPGGTGSGTGGASTGSSAALAFVDIVDHRTDGKDDFFSSGIIITNNTSTEARGRIRGKGRKGRGKGSVVVVVDNTVVVRMIQQRQGRFGMRSFFGKVAKGVRQVVVIAVVVVGRRMNGGKVQDIVLASIIIRVIIMFMMQGLPSSGFFFVAKGQVSNRQFLPVR